MIFRGVATALITPFKDGSPDRAAFVKMLDLQAASGVAAVVVLGTTGEPATLCEREKRMVLSTAVERLKGKLPVIAGVGSNDTKTSAEACKWAEELGADALLVVTPYYNKCTQSGLIRHYEALAASTALPIICYNVPSRTGVNILPETFAKLAEIDNIAGIKEASGNMQQIEECIALADGRADVYSGDDALALPVLAMGGAGVISVASNIFPELIVRMTYAYFDGDAETARKLQLKLLPLIKALFSEVNPIPVKRAAELMGLCDGQLRLPLTRISEANDRALQKAISDLLSSDKPR